jgi:hypothetical protein
VYTQLRGKTQGHIALPHESQRLCETSLEVSRPATFQDNQRQSWPWDLYFWGRIVAAHIQAASQSRANAKVIIDPSGPSFKAEMIKRGIRHVEHTHGTQGKLSGKESL